MSLCLEHSGIGFEKALYSDAGDDKELALNENTDFLDNHLCQEL